MSHLQFYRAILSRNFIARKNRMRDMPCRTLQLCRINNQRSPHFRDEVAQNYTALLYSETGVARLLRSCATHHVTLAILSRDKIAGVTSV